MLLAEGKAGILIRQNLESFLEGKPAKAKAAGRDAPLGETAEAAA
jgi:hypothetical protein